MKKIGSTWNLWDLHIHTNASDGKGTCQEILEVVKSKGISCIAVTDHHTIDNIEEMKTLAKPMNITVISGIEFRTEYGQASVHMIGLFPDEHNGIKLSPEFLKENVLNQLGISRTSIIQKAKDSGSQSSDETTLFKEGMFLVQVEFKKAADIIHKYGGIVTVHAGSKENGIDREMRHEGSGVRNTSIECSLGPVKEELFNEGYIDICEIKKPNEAKFYLEKFGKPSITASDAHELNEIGIKPCWIKADLAFEGLKQIISEPERISYEEPLLLQRIKRNPDKFIDSLEITRVAGASMPETWFNNIRIDINPGLVAIIGNKGSGKSALTDILALCANTKNEAFSFLTPNKFRMNKPYNRSKQIEAIIGWADKSHSQKKTLDESPDINHPERVKYIPQNFLENLCTTEDDGQFEKELKKIIFQYLNPAERYGKNDLDSLIKYLTTENERSCQNIKDKIREINTSIVDLELQLEPNYKTKLENELKYKQEQLSNAQSAKPIEIKKPDLSGNPKAQEAKTKLEKIQNELNELNEKLEQLQIEQTQLVKRLQDLISVKENLSRLFEYIENVKVDINPILTSNDINIDEILNFKYNHQIIEIKIKQIESRIKIINKEFEEENEQGLINTIKTKQKTLVDVSQELSEPEIKYQKYLVQKLEWEKSIEDITGTEEKEGSIKNLQCKLDYIERHLANDIESLKVIRKQEINKLVNKKSEVLRIYNNLFAPIVKFVEEYKDALKDYPIEFDATFAIRGFEDYFFDFVNQQIAGSFYGKEQGLMRVKDNIENINLLDLDSIIEFPSSINEALQYDKRDGANNALRNIEAQLKKGHTKQDLYDYIYSMDYIVPFFQLKMNGKPLSSLSPGERGALLLLLYLFIDMDDKPLIIDQPEENLDNESVYKYIVHFIKEAKRRRQIIMVTHNPNLAVVCDADQIIQMKIDKQNGNTVSYESGAIENPTINKIIVDILEGTYPAFHNRDSKYFDKIV